MERESREMTDQLVQASIQLANAISFLAREVFENHLSSIGETRCIVLEHAREEFEAKLRELLLSRGTA
jgi:hypothetical protein